MVDKVKDYLKYGGTLVSFSPTIEQVKKTVSAMKSHSFIEINTYELIIDPGSMIIKLGKRWVGASLLHN